MPSLHIPLRRYCYKQVQIPKKKSTDHVSCYKNYQEVVSGCIMPAIEKLEQLGLIENYYIISHKHIDLRFTAAWDIIGVEDHIKRILADYSITGDLEPYYYDGDDYNEYTNMNDLALQVNTKLLFKYLKITKDELDNKPPILRGWIPKHPAHLVHFLMNQWGFTNTLESFIYSTMSKLQLEVALFRTGAISIAFFQKRHLEEARYYFKFFAWTAIQRIKRNLKRRFSFAKKEKNNA